MKIFATKTITFSILALSSLSALAQHGRRSDLSDVAFNVADNVSRNERFLSPEESRQIRGLLNQVNTIINNPTRYETRFNVSTITTNSTANVALDVTSTADFLKQCIETLPNTNYFVNSLKTVVNYSHSLNHTFARSGFMTDTVQICGAAASLASQLRIPTLSQSSNFENIVAFSVQGKSILLKGRSVQEIGMKCQQLREISGSLFVKVIPLSINGARLKEVIPSSPRGFITTKDEVCLEVMTEVRKAAHSREFMDMRY